MTREEFDAYMTLESKDTTQLFVSLAIINSLAQVELLSNADGSVYYKASIKEILDNNPSTIQLRNLCNGGWTIEGDFLIKKL